MVKHNRHALSAYDSAYKNNIVLCNPTKLYLAHTILGHSLRSLANDYGVHPSTVLRRVRRVEEMREDPLIDEYLDDMAKTNLIDCLKKKKDNPVKNTGKTVNNTPIKLIKFTKPQKEELRILRRLCENNTFLVISNNFDKGIILRKTNKKSTIHIATISRKLAKLLVINDWIKCTKRGKVNIYHVTDVGLCAVRRMICQQKMKPGHDYQVSSFGDQHRVMELRHFTSTGKNKRIKTRVNLRENPLVMLARKKDANGNPFLTEDLLQAGERLREDFELSQIRPSVTQNWEQFKIGIDGRKGYFPADKSNKSDAAARRLNAALSALGSGLGDIAMRCCCFSQGLEMAEKRMGWSARSGKIVLRIALQRLENHYKEQYGELSLLIG